MNTRVTNYSVRNPETIPVLNYLLYLKIFQSVAMRHFVLHMSSTHIFTEIYSRFNNNGWVASGQRLDKCVERTQCLIALDDVRTGYYEGHHFVHYRLKYSC